MEWVLILSIQWGSASTSTSTSTTNAIEGFTSAALCQTAAQAIKTELDLPFAPIGRANTLGRIVCVQRK
jgi:hypothetical protein